jgi:hypothetical protein
MCEVLHLPLVALRRIQIGSISLGDLQKALRNLTEEELKPQKSSKIWFDQRSIPSSIITIPPRLENLLYFVVNAGFHCPIECETKDNNIINI